MGIRLQFAIQHFTLPSSYISIILKKKTREKREIRNAKAESTSSIFLQRFYIKSPVNLSIYDRRADSINGDVSP